MSARPLAAVDLGASSGRVMLAHVERDRIALDEVHRFANEPVRLPDGLHWDILRLYHEVLLGLAMAQRQAGEEPLSIAVDSWAVDYGLLDEAGRLLGNPYHYRDERTADGVQAVHELVDQAALYARTGVAFLPFNTLYQLAAARRNGELEGAATMLLIPDLLGYWLSGQRVAETTNASTTGLLDVHRREWDDELIGRLGLVRELFPEVCSPGQVVGGLLPHVLEDVGLRAGAQLLLVGSHDTASAVVAVPAAHDRFAYISCGTWALVGLEIERPVLTEEARLAGFTNEAGVDGRVRFLHNVMGLWLLQESLRTWERRGLRPDLDALLAEAAELPAGGPVVDPNDPQFLPPGDMPAKIADVCARAGQPPPHGPAATVRCILDSLASAFGEGVETAASLSGGPVEVVHLVGGGARNSLLCQLTADACGLPVLAGPAEATALGNVLLQARTHAAVGDTLEELRALVARTQPVARYEPRS